MYMSHGRIGISWAGTIERRGVLGKESQLTVNQVR